MPQVAIPWNSPITNEGNPIVGRVIDVGDHRPLADIDRGLDTAKDRPVADIATYRKQSVTHVKPH